MRAKRRASRARASVGPFTEPVEAAKAASLRYVSDERPGIRRRKSGTGFSYLDSDGKVVRDKATLKRIRALAIPPAWTAVWVCPMPDGHLQATGRDARGRKQYRYHARWNEVRDETKYGRMELFGQALPKIRARLEDDLGLPGLPKEKLLAVIVRLLEATSIRVGNEEYAKANGSFGLTTLLNRHVQVQGSKIRFRFPGKSGKLHSIGVADRRLAKVIQRSRDLPGQDLFQFLDEEGNAQPISSSDVNEYLRTISGQEFTAKDFRTWSGTLLAAQMLGEAARFDDEDVAVKSATAAAVAEVARALGNTPAVCRKCYIHPLVLEAYQDRSIFDRWLTARGAAGAKTGLSQDESGLLRLLADTSAD